MLFEKKLAKGLKKINDRRFEYMLKQKKGKMAKMSIPDLIAMQSDFGEFMRVDAIVRYLAVKEYYEGVFGGISGFALYCKMQDIRNGEGFALQAEEKFRKLIESYGRKGYDHKYSILLDKNLRLIDGSHRLALGMYHDVKVVNVFILDMEVPTEDYSIDWFYQNGFTNEELELIKRTRDEIAARYQIAFTGIIWSPAVSCAKQMLEDMSAFGRISDVKYYDYPKEQYENIVRKLYAIDDIEGWKIDKKLEHMKKCSGSLVSFRITFDNPRYRLKQSSNLPLSVQVERLKKNIRTKYKGYIKNYFYDIVLHIADNDYQSYYMNHILEPDINVKDILEIMNRYEYALIKTDVPYFPKDFPETFPVGKDLDVICSYKDYWHLVNKVIRFAKQSKEYEIVVVKGENNTRIRYEMFGNLILQVDISCVMEGVKTDFLREAIAKRKKEKEYYVLENAHEYLMRMREYAKAPSKKHHLRYLRMHRADYSEMLATKYLAKDVLDIYGNKLEKLGRL